MNLTFAILSAHNLLKCKHVRQTKKCRTEKMVFDMWRWVMLCKLCRINTRCSSVCDFPLLNCLRLSIHRSPSRRGIGSSRRPSQRYFVNVALRNTCKPGEILVKCSGGSRIFWGGRHHIIWFVENYMKMKKIGSRGRPKFYYIDPLLKCTVLVANFHQIIGKFNDK